MDIREQRGLIIASTAKIRPYGERWMVASQTGNGFYMVSFTAQTPECSCPDYETRRENCTHIYATICVMQREQNAQGTTTVTDAFALAATESRPTYGQAWTAYNAAQTNEKEKFQSLLAGLCRGIPKPIIKGPGRPGLPISDAVFSVAFKVYSTVSARRFMCDLREAKQRGFISRTPHYNSIFNYLEHPDMMPILRDLITQSSLPLQSVETEFAADSSGFMTSRFVRWFEVKYGKRSGRTGLVKCHLMCGVKTNIVTAVEIGDKHASDSNFFAPLVESTSRHFDISEVSADKAYGSLSNTDTVVRLGGTPFIAFRGNATGGIGGTWQQMFHCFMFRKQEFLQHYHKRSNIESTFSMMKRKFGDSLRSKTDVAMVNETLGKILCHNLVVLIHEMCELGIDPVFWNNTAKPN
jgi:transposase